MKQSMQWGVQHRVDCAARHKIMVLVPQIHPGKGTDLLQRLLMATNVMLDSWNTRKTGSTHDATVGMCLHLAVQHLGGGLCTHGHIAT